MRSPSFARIRDAAGAFAIHRVLRERESWSRDRLLAFQHVKLRDLVAYARRDRIEASVRLRENGEPSLPETLRAALEARLREHGAAAEVVVDVVAHLAREGGAAKQKLVRRIT